MNTEELLAYRRRILARRKDIATYEFDYAMNGRMERELNALIVFEQAAEYHAGMLEEDEVQELKEIAETIGIDHETLKEVPRVPYLLNERADPVSACFSDSVMALGLDLDSAPSTIVLVPKWVGRFLVDEETHTIRRQGSESALEYLEQRYGITGLRGIFWSGSIAEALHEAARSLHARGVSGESSEH